MVFRKSNFEDPNVYNLIIFVITVVADPVDLLEIHKAHAPGPDFSQQAYHSIFLQAGLAVKIQNCYPSSLSLFTCRLASSRFLLV
jgi:hypothetical protein